MKNSKYILIAVAVIIVVLVGMMKTKDPVADAPSQETIDICYVWNTEAGDNASLRMSFSGPNGSNVSGSLNLRPAEKDSKTGVFAGTAGSVNPQSMTRTASLIWQASGEGVTNPEELSVIFGEGNAAVGFGEMKDRGDGTYVYANPQAVSYEPILQQVDCADPALK